MIEWLAFLVSAMLGTTSPIGKCDPIDGPKLHWSRADRQQLRAEIQDAAPASPDSAAPRKEVLVLSTQLVEAEQLLESRESKRTGRPPTRKSG